METDYLFHITKPENVESILKNGLMANSDRQIFLYEGRIIETNCFVKINGELWMCRARDSVERLIAANEVFIKIYSVLRVDVRGIELHPDDVAEIGSKWQWIANRDVIEPHRLACIETLDVGMPDVIGKIQKLDTMDENLSDFVEWQRYKVNKAILQADMNII